MSLSCVEVEPMIGYLLDNELDQDQSLEVETHLESCDACCKVLEQQGNLRDVLRRAAASVDTPHSLRARLHVTLDRERRSQVGMARAWPAAVAAAVLVSFIWNGADSKVHAAHTQLTQVTQAHTRSIPMDVTSSDADVVTHFLRAQLQIDVPLAALAKQLSQSAPRQIAARIVDKNARQSALIRIEYEHGSASLMVSPAVSELSPQASEGQVQASLLTPTKSAANAARPQTPYVAQDAKGLTVAQWETSRLMYDMVCDLPPADVMQGVSGLAGAP